MTTMPGEKATNVTKVIFVLAITAFIIMLVAFGVSAFYKPPEQPQYDTDCFKTPELPMPSPGTPEYDEWQQQECQQEYDKHWEAYENTMKGYHRNVFAMSYPVGLLSVLLGLTLRKKLDTIWLGLLLGGIGTMVYAISQSHLEMEFRFVGAAVGLAVLIYAAYKTLLEKKLASA